MYAIGPYGDTDRLVRDLKAAEAAGTLDAEGRAILADLRDDTEDES